MTSEELLGDAQRWRTAEHARNWIARMDRGEASQRAEELQVLVSFLTFDADAELQFLELGAGHGLLTAEVLDHFTHANVVALDLSPTMIDQGRQRLAGYGSRVTFYQWDLADAGWPADGLGPFDAAISSLALHHLGRQRKSELTRDLYAHLKPGGLFLNLDYVGAASPALEERYRQAASVPEASHAADNGHRRGGGGHAHLPLWPLLDDLHQAGFEDVDIFWKRMNLTLFGGTRPRV